MCVKTSSKYYDNSGGTDMKKDFKKIFSAVTALAFCCTFAFSLSEQTGLKFSENKVYAEETSDTFISNNQTYGITADEPTELPTYAPTEPPTELPTYAPTEPPTSEPTTKPPSTSVSTTTTTATPSSDGLVFETSDDYAAVVDCDESVTSVIVPETYEGLPVKKISAEAFAECYFMTNIILPETITTIEYRAFEKCERLISIEIPEGVTEIPYYAFSECSSLSSVIIPESVTCISSYAFNFCSSLKNIVLPDSVITISDHAFNYAELTSITLSKNLESIGSQSFYHCDGLTEITFPESLKAIGNEAFRFSGLVEVNLPDNIKSIAEYSFSDCYDMTDLTIGNGITNIADGAFYNCTHLKNVTIGNKVARIGSRAFYWNECLEEIVIPYNVKAINGAAFCYCENLKRIVIKNPDCEIYDSDLTICNKSIENSGYAYYGVIVGHENSAAQQYADKYSRRFEAVSCGDINCDGEITISDVVLFQQALANKKVNEALVLYVLDVNHDEKFDVFDLITIKRMVLNT